MRVDPGEGPLHSDWSQTYGLLIFCAVLCASVLFCVWNNITRSFSSLYLYRLSEPVPTVITVRVNEIELDVAFCYCIHLPLII